MREEKREKEGRGRMREEEERKSGGREGGEKLIEGGEWEDE